jgi:hypothetical protein
MSKRFALATFGLLLMLKDPPKRDERGISQSAESAILLAGAVAIAIVVVALITSFVRAKLAKL